MLVTDIRKNLAAICAVIVGLALSACATQSSVLESRQRNEGLAVVYDCTYDEAWRISKRVLQWSGAESIMEQPEDNLLLATEGMDLLTFGSHSGVWITSISPKYTEVTVISRRQFQLDITTGMTKSGFHTRFDYALGELRDTGRLPLRDRSTNPTTE